MPMNYQPNIRSIQEVMETTKMYQSLDSAGITALKAREVAGTSTKDVPKTHIVYLGTTYTPS